MRWIAWADVDWTPLTVSIQFSDLEVVRALLEAGADPNARWCTSLVRDRDATTWPVHPACTLEAGMSPLAWACRLKRRDVIDALLEHGADRATRDVGLR
jgi:ankyrin repeat protein